MDGKKEAFRKRLLVTFQVEAAEHIQTLSSGLMDLERSSAAESHAHTLESIFREAHSLKGAARAVNATAIERICQSLENVFSSWQRKETVPSPALFDVLHRATDLLNKILLTLDASDDSGKAGGDSAETASLIASLEQTLHDRLPTPRSEQQPPAATKVSPLTEAGTSTPEARLAPMDTVRLPAARLGSLFLEAEELLMAKLAARQREAEVEEIQSALVAWKKVRAQTRPLLRSLASPQDKAEHSAGSTNGNGKGDPRVRKLAALQEQDEDLFRSLEDRLDALARSSQRDRRSLERMVDQLLESARQVVMLPASSLLESFPRLARDLARDRGKTVELELQGADIEMDRRILEEMREPLLHLLRNSIDHGIEPGIERKRANKPEQGVLRIALRRKDSDKAELLVSDDGRGIQVDGVRAAASKLGLLVEDETQPSATPDQKKALDLIFQSGVSTSPIITDLSGRGLGLAIVREKVERLGGTVSIETVPGNGTTFRMILPFTRAAFRGVVVRVDEHLFVLPSVQVERVLRFQRSDVKTVENRETLIVEGRATALVRLSDALELRLRNGSAETERGQAVLLGSAEKRIAICVDEVIDEQEVLAKSLGKQLAEMRNLSGATVLGNGRVVPILNIADLLAVAANAGAAAPATAPVQTERIKKSILVAEDSITSRSLLKNILETAGYDVQTAVDGAEAFATLKTASFDLVVSDVEMPRMSGFELAAKIRSESAIAGLPVVLVTALGSREDRERGIDAGANAYIVKSNFDQSNLLEVVRRLL
jgi:two-component system chemotaxis sensor kinase CheA